ncbi:response regulator with CheY-like receiver, AAA-type ATPase, and DNA-binding domains [Burkholderiales bacterium JOSHI_001]|nr:response regulator with CheY-like receiver, AAA-type ATPase, and DNA-binding domains [Burkholderiales bacterium JOSHI_001]
MPGAILIIEDEAVLAKNMRIYLEREGYEVRCADNAEDGLAALDLFRPDAVVLDFNLPGMDGLEALARVKAQDPKVQVIMVTGHGNVEMAVMAMKAGALDFLTKPVPLAKLRMLLERATADVQRDSALEYYRRRDEQGTDLSTLQGESAGMQKLKGTLRQLLAAEARLADGEAPAVLVTGETGTGKELVARALHFNGPRRDKPFVEINCAALPAQLLESELFGHERGAFTDARERKLGLVETADGGTLFLDEIGDMEAGLQAKLLKLLEERTVRRLGSVREQKVNVRIVAATHRPLEQLVRDGLFRADLYFRLRVVQLSLPPLRERGDDILLLARNFVQWHAQRYGRAAPVLAPATERLLVQHPWPGNVRELRNVLEQAVLLCPGGVIDVSQLALSSHPMAASPGAEAPPAAAPPAARTLPEMEREALVKALAGASGNISRAARDLGVSRDTLRYRIEKHGLQNSLMQDLKGPAPGSN